MTSDETHAAPEPSTAAQDIVLELNYADKLFATFQRLEQSLGRLMRFQIFLSIVLIALVTGLVSTDEQVEITWIKLELPLWVLVGGGGLTIGILASITAIETVHGDLLAREIVSIYTANGYRVPKRNADRHLGLGSSLADSMMSAWDPTVQVGGGRRLRFARWIAVVTGGILLSLPVAAQLAVIAKLGSDFDWTWLVWLPLGGVLLVHLASLIWAGPEPGIATYVKRPLGRLMPSRRAK